VSDVCSSAELDPPAALAVLLLAVLLLAWFWFWLLFEPVFEVLTLPVLAAPPAAPAAPAPVLLFLLFEFEVLVFFPFWLLLVFDPLFC